MSDKPDVELLSLIGEHLLDAADTVTEAIKSTLGDYFEDSEVMRFRLDGIVYTAVSDPDDGYRSSMDRLFISPEAKLLNTFPPVRVFVRKKADDEHYVNNTIEMVDAVTGKVVIEVGTDNSDDYYPSFVSAFHPENMTTNSRGGATS